MCDSFPVELHQTECDVVEDAEADQAIKAVLEIDLFAHITFSELEDQIGDLAGNGIEPGDLRIAVCCRNNDPGEVALLAVFKDVAFVVVRRGEVLKRASRIGLFECLRKIERLQEMLLALCG
jgi:hypothetical protein